MPRTLAFFDGSTNVTGGELWATDGTASGTSLISDIISGPAGSDPANFAPTGTGTVVFSANDGRTSGPESFVSDGAAAGTTKIAQVRGGSTTGHRASPCCRMDVRCSRQPTPMEP